MKTMLTEFNHQWKKNLNKINNPKKLSTMKKLFTTMLFACFALACTTVYAQETVTIKLYGSGGSRTITCNGESSTNGKLTVEKGSIVYLNSESTDFTWAFFTKDNTHKNGSEIVSNERPYSFIAEENATYYINYIGRGTDENLSLDATVTAVANGNGTATVNDVASKEVKLGDRISLSAVANDGCEFVNWTVDGVEISTEADCDVIVQKTATYTANFTGGDNSTSINSVETSKNDVIFDLSGNKVNKVSQKGIYIINGKKVVK